MFSYYWKIALRSLSRNRTYTVINVLGLSVATAASLLLHRIVSYELAFDRHHRNYDRIVRVVTNTQSPVEGEGFSAGVPIPAMDVVQQTTSQLSEVARVHSMWPVITVPDAPGSKTGLKINTDEQREVGAFVEPSFFRVFDWQWLAGDAQTALVEPYTVVLNRSMAERCFGQWEAAVGKTVLMDNQFLLTVRGVVADAPTNSDFPLHVIVSYETVKKHQGIYNYQPDWGNISSNDQMFALLTDKNQLEAANKAIREVGVKEYRNHTRGGEKYHVLQPLSELHFDQRLSHIGLHHASKNQLWVLSFIGLLVVAMACFNFINLATAQAAGRSKEVGVRKTLGSNRGQLMGQFLGETAIITGFSVALGIALAYGLTPYLRHISHLPADIAFITEPSVWLYAGLLAVTITVLSGLYPAVIIAGFDPIKALKNSLHNQKVAGVSVRKALVVLQFVIAQGLIIGALIAISQLNYIRRMDLGFSPDFVYVVQGVDCDSATMARQQVFREQLLQIPGVQQVSIGSDIPSSGNTWMSNFALGSGSEDAPFNTTMKLVDAHYLDAYGIRLAAGRNLMPSDTPREVLVNQTLLKKLGLPAPDALGQELRLGGRTKMTVVGVVEDFMAHSARSEMEPLIITTQREHYSLAGIKVNATDNYTALPAIRATFERIFPEKVFDGRYMDESIARFYRNETRFTAMCQGFALLAIFIACLGLLGLASLVAVQRTKEIGVRKVLGASVAGILGLMSRDFIRLVLIAAVIAGPLAYYAMQRWLQDFVYRTPISVWVFVATIGAAVLAAFLSVCFQTLRVARTNPVDTLRSE
jgi:putative ABC transport system permease protein